MAINETRLQEFLGTMLNELGAAANSSLVMKGDEGGHHKAIADAEPLTPAQLTRRTRTGERYVREDDDIKTTLQAQHPEWSAGFINAFVAIGSIVLLAVFLSGCGGGYKIQYSLNENDLIMSQSALPLKVCVAKFTDNRPPEDRQKVARKDKKYSDVGDYTYDEGFEGEVSQEITNMIVKHLNYSGVFKHVSVAPSTSEAVSQTTLDAMRNKGFDAVMVGEIKHFYGYYDNHGIRQLLYGLGLGYLFSAPYSLYDPPSPEPPYISISIFDEEYDEKWDKYEEELEEYDKRLDEARDKAIAGFVAGASAGLALETFHKRKIESATQLVVKLISTSTHDVIWEGTFEASEKSHGRIPSFWPGHEKFNLALKSLHYAANQMVESLSKISVPAFSGSDAGNPGNLVP